MAVISKVNPNFPIPGIDQSSKGFRDNFATIKTEIENLQSKTITIVGDINGISGTIDSGTSPLVINTVGKVYRKTFITSDLSLGVLTVTHDLGQQIVLVQVSDNTNQVLVPDSITLTNATSLAINLASYGALTGSWNVIVRG